MFLRLGYSQMKKVKSTQGRDPSAVTRRYLPDSRMDSNPIGAIGAMAAEIWRFRSHISVVFVGDFRSAYRGTKLGVLWNIILPLVPISVYILLVNLRIFPQYEGLSPAVYIGFNVTIWMLLTGMITRPMQVVRQRTQEAMRTSIPLTAAISSSFAQLSFDTLVRLVLVAALVIWFGPVPIVHLPLLLFTLFSGMVFCLSLGLILSIFNMIYPDIDRLTSIILQYGIFMSGVIFPVSTMGPLALLEDVNPFNVFIKSAREYLFFGTHIDLTVLLIWSGVALLLALIAGRFFYVMEHRIREIV